MTGPGAGDFTDDMFDVAAVEAGCWVPGPYGPGDERGSFNEVTPDKTARAIAMLDPSKPIRTYNLGETLFNGFPATASTGGREYAQSLYVLGYDPGSEFEGTCVTTTPIGPNRISVHEERVRLTYNMGTKINGLTHVGVADMYYNGFRAPDMARTWGTEHLGIERAGPVVTRGLLLDVAGYKAASGAHQDYFLAGSGRPVLRSNYRITLEDLRGTMEWEELPPEPFEPGDVILIRTGWRALIEEDPVAYVQQLPPGPFLRETRYLAAHRPAIIGIDVWVYGVVDPDVDGGNRCCCHQELFVKHGIRIGEAVASDELADDRVYEFVFCLNPTRARGAVSSNSPPMALGQPGR